MVAPVARASQVSTGNMEWADRKVWPLAAIAILVAAQFTMVFTHAVNWDEFLHYGMLYDLNAGERIQALQTLYLRLYQWIPELPGKSIDHIIAARLGQMVCELVTVGAIFVTARRFVNSGNAALCALAYFSTGYVLQNGFAFRADPVLTMVLMLALALLASRPLDWLNAAVVGALAGLATIISIKAGLYITAFAGLAWLKWKEDGLSRSLLLRFAAVSVSAALTFGAMYWLHTSLMGTATAPASNAGTSLAITGSAFDRMFFLGRPNNLGALVGAISTGLGIFALVVLAPVAIYRRDCSQSEKIALFGLLLPVFLPLFYENSAAYFYVFMLAPVSVAVCASVEMLRPKVPLLVMAALFLALASSTVFFDNRRVLDAQIRVENEIDRMFPEPIAYFDHANRMARFDKLNPFQSPWGYRSYLAREVPIYRNAIEREPVPLIIVDWQTFGELLISGNDEYFLTADAAALRSNYRQFNGPIWLAGKAFEAGHAAEEEFLVPGPYTVSGGTVRIDGRDYKLGDVVHLSRGIHQIAAHEQPVELWWGEDLRPEDDLSGLPSWARL